MKTPSFCFILWALVAVACQNPQTTPPVTITLDQVHVDYTSCGSGDTTLLFLHGWCIDKTYWSEQVKRFCPRYRVVTVDLPGFGLSGHNRNTWTIEKYGEDVARIIDALQLKNVVLIGHSMSGNIMLEAAARKPELIAGLVGVDNFKDFGSEFTAEQQAAVAGFMIQIKKDFPGTSVAYAEGNLLHPTTDSIARKRILQSFAGADPAVAIPVLESLLAVGSREQVLAPQMKQHLFLINSDASPTDEKALQSFFKAGVTVVPVPATGHYPMIEKPEEFNRALEKVLAGL